MDFSIRNLCIPLLVLVAGGLPGGIPRAFSQVNSQENRPRTETELQLGVEKIFVTRCFECHSGEGAESGFRLDVPSADLNRGGESGQVAIVPGNIHRGSLLQYLVASDESERMPPEGEPLSKREIALVRQWIEQGARIDAPFREGKTDLWSFQPVRRPTLPARKSIRQRTAIDAFVEQQLTNRQLQFSGEETKRGLVRRLFLVMLGLPPTPAEVSRFVGDPRPDAYERLVERVLSSTAYGERWAQHWLDIIRFGETQGFETNRERPNAWPYRDYVIEALNSDKPYDQFVREQLAGDQLGNDVATGFIVSGPHDIVKSPDINLTLMQRQDELADIVNVTGTTFLGLTVGCARCHNHKFDPITQKDFYSMQALFAGVNHAERGLPISYEAEKEAGKLRQRMAVLKGSLEKFRKVPTRSMVVIDDTDRQSLVGIRYLVEPEGEGINPPGRNPGYRDDPGSASRAANISGGKYTWWKNRPGRELAVYRPWQAGQHRIWLSWGAGHSTHSANARYELDRDGKLETRDDRKLLATVDQVRMADGSGKAVGQALWSGFRNAGVVDLLPESKIVLLGGTDGTAVTTDVMLLEKVDAERSAVVPQKPGIRTSVNVKANVDSFAPTEARYVRFTIEKTNGAEACIDELEIFVGEKNVALAREGATASSGGDYVHPLHKLAHINDGRYGNPRSWIAKQKTGWVQIQLPSVQRIDRVEWARDRQGKFADRLAVKYRIEVSLDGRNWKQVSSSADRLAFQASKVPPRIEYDFSGFDGNQATQGQSWLAEYARLESKLDRISKKNLVYAGTFSQPGPTHRLYRGDPLQKREMVSPNTLVSLGDLGLPLDAKEADRRTGFSKWLTRSDNPLLARVIVNRLWQHVFGRGIVGTPNDFGNSGRPPTHPKLLDWLASELVQADWSIKHLHRLILTSHVFRQSSRPTENGLAADAGCLWLWRFPPRRLEAETIRDSMLAVSGVLDRKVGGKGFDGFEIQLENVRHFFPKKDYGPSDWRRMIYMTKVRQEKDSVFGAFDCPDGSQIIDRRSRSTTPLQSLNLLNSRFTLQQAELMTGRLKRLLSNREPALGNRTSERDAWLVNAAWEIVFSRPASREEIEDGRAFLSEFGLPAFCRALLNSSEFLFIQ